MPGRPHGQERARPHVGLAARELHLLGQEAGDPRPDAEEDLLRVLALGDEERVLRERRHHLPPDVLALDLVEREDIGLLAGEELHPRRVARIGVLHVLDVPGRDGESLGHGRDSHRAHGPSQFSGSGGAPCGPPARSTARALVRVAVQVADPPDLVLERAPVLEHVQAVAQVDDVDQAVLDDRVAPHHDLLVAARVGVGREPRILELHLAAAASGVNSASWYGRARVGDADRLEAARVPGAERDVRRERRIVRRVGRLRRVPRRRTSPGRSPARGTRPSPSGRRGSEMSTIRVQPHGQPWPGAGDRAVDLVGDPRPVAAPQLHRAVRARARPHRPGRR